MEGGWLGFLPQWILVVVVIVLVLGAIATGIRAIPPIWHFVAQFIETVNTIATLSERLERGDKHMKALDERLDDITNAANIISHELQPNSGSSAVDKLGRMEGTLAAIAAHIGIENK